MLELNFQIRRLPLLWVVLGLVAHLVAPRVEAGKIGVAYIKNNHSSRVDVWINGYYQGYVPSGKTCYTVYEGFVTSDSGYNSKGELVIKESHAGWDNSGARIEIMAIGHGKTLDERFYWQATFENSGKGSSGFLGSSEAAFWTGGPPEFGDLDREFAGSILKGAGNWSWKDKKSLIPAGNKSPAKAGGYMVGGNSSGVKVMAEGDAAAPSKNQFISSRSARWEGVTDVVFYADGTFEATMSNIEYKRGAWKVRAVNSSYTFVIVTGDAVKALLLRSLGSFNKGAESYLRALADAGRLRYEFCFVPPSQGPLEAKVADGAFAGPDDNEGYRSESTRWKKSR
jgi:hypothetical protein